MNDNLTKQKWIYLAIVQRTHLRLIRDFAAEYDTI